METRLWNGWLRFISRLGQRRDFFLFTTVPRLALEHAHPSIQQVLGVKWLGCEANNSCPFSAKVWSCTSPPQYTFMARDTCLHGMGLG